MDRPIPSGNRVGLYITASGVRGVISLVGYRGVRGSTPLRLSTVRFTPSRSIKGVSSTVMVRKPRVVSVSSRYRGDHPIGILGISFCGW